MTLQPSDTRARVVLNDADLAFLDDLVVLLHRAVRVSDVAATRSPDPAVRALALAHSTHERDQVAAIRRCLAEAGGTAAGEQHPADASGCPSVLLPWMLPTEATEDLATVATADFDEHYLGRLAEHHRAAIECSRAEMVEGLSTRGRRIAEEAIARSSAGLHRIHDLIGTRPDDGTTT